MFRNLRFFSTSKSTKNFNKNFNEIFNKKINKKLLKGECDKKCKCDEGIFKNFEEVLCKLNRDNKSKSNLNKK